MECVLLVKTAYVLRVMGIYCQIMLQRAVIFAFFVHLRLISSKESLVFVERKCHIHLNF